MDTLPRARASRRGNRSFVTKMLTKAKGITHAEGATPESITKSDRQTIDLILNQLTTKKRQLEELDVSIAAATTSEEELEEEIIEAQLYQFDLTEQITALQRFSSTSTPKKITQTTQKSQLVELQPVKLIQVEQPADNNEQLGAAQINQPVTASHSAPAATNMSTNSVSDHVPVVPHTPVVHNVGQFVTRLPKLTLPTFSGDPLQFQTFWDSFEAAIHNNEGLTGVQKLHYLRAQLDGDAARVIDNFPLTDSNYLNSVALLKNRFGQPYKLVDAHFNALTNLPKPVNTLNSLQAFHDSLESHMRALSSLGTSPDTYSPMLTRVVLGKLPIELRKQFTRDHHSGEWTIREVLDSILKEIRVLEVGNFSTGFSKEHHSTAASFHTAAGKGTPQRSKREVVCTYCKGPHTANQCTVVKGHQQRVSIVKTAGLCYNCLAHHKVSQCTSHRRCRQCNQKHHTSLCPPTNTQPPPIVNTVQPPQATNSAQPQTSSSTGPQPSPTTNNTQVPALTAVADHPPSAHSACLLKTAIATISAGSISAEGNILFDEGAQRSFITQNLADRLCLKATHTERISLSSFGHPVSSARSLQVATISVHTLDHTVIPISVLIVPQLAAPLQNSLRVNIRTVPYLKDLKLAHPVTEDDCFEISILVGADYYWTFVQDHIIRGDGPTAVQSRLGYLLSGPLLQPSAAVTLVHVNFTTVENQTLDAFWKAEASGLSPDAVDNDNSFLTAYMRSGIKRQPNGALSLKFPWKENHPTLPNNFSVCAKRTRSLAQRLAHTPELLHMYGKILADQEGKGFIEKVKDFNTKQVHYIPHRPVKKDSDTTPIRIVYDCSCKQSSQHPSLNDCLHIGPPFLNHMCAILLRFRQYVYAFTADIEKAFLHVELDESDRDYTRFLWLSNPHDPHSSLQPYRFKVVLFGASCSPFMLNAALTFHLQQHPSPVSTNILRSLYVDNVVSGCNTEQEAIEYFSNSRQLMNISKFNLRTWASNSESLRVLAKQHNVADEKEIVKILGLRWNVKLDQLSLCSKPEAPTATLVTKREILRYTSSIFDPLGFVTPVTIAAKLLLQDLWQDSVSWDTELTKPHQIKWASIATDISVALQQSFPRQYIPKLLTVNSSSPSLHVFADASSKAYGAVVYIQHANCSSLVISKSRVAPLKQHTLPRLELMAASIAARLGSFVVDSLDYKPNLHFWSDSQIVLCWLQSKKKLKPFIAHRVKDILDVSSSWGYCPTNCNPADLLTRGLSAQQFTNSTLWRHGPPWLLSPTEWPSWNPSEALLVQANSAEESLSSGTNHNTTLLPLTNGVHNLIDPSAYSNYTKLLDVTAYVLRFAHNTRQKLFKLTGPLTSSELSISNIKWLTNVQQRGFPEELNNLRSTKSSSRLPLVRQLRLYLDHTGLIRCGGRIHNAPLAESTKFPILLPSKDPFTSLLIWHTHKAQFHSGVSMTLTALRQMYWVPCARQRIRTLLRKCVTCRKLAGQPYTAPDPPPLVKARVQQSMPFEVTGIDFTGALYVRGEQERKVYICLFTCAVTRAVHLEVVTDLTVECFLQAFRRFSGRKSLPRLVLSDNGSTFLSAADELKALFSSPSLTNTLSKLGIEWRFIPKRAPWFGGFWERLIGLTKLTLKKVLGRAFTTLNSLQTIIVEIEAILNDRPLTYVPTDANDPDPITPAHLLYGRKMVCVPYHMTPQYNKCDPDFGETAIQARNKKQGALLQQFWSRWRNEYLTGLREFHHTNGSNVQTVKPGAIVLVHDDTPRISWRLAVIEDVITGEDGLVRAANIRTSTGKTNRPITKLYPLEVSTSDSLPQPENSSTHTENVRSSTNGDIATEKSEDGHTKERRPIRQATLKGRQQIQDWAKVLCAPPEDVRN